jgi:hypothetical protein
MTFSHWLLNRQVPDSDRLSMLIQQAGRNGIPEGQLRSQVELPFKLVTQLLQAMVSARMVGVVERDGMRVYLSR